MAKSRKLLRIGAAAFVLLLGLIVSLPRNSSAQAAGSIEAVDQKVVDGKIVVRQATISQDGWIIVHKAGPDGKILVSPEIGKARLRAGESADVAIELSEPVADGAPLWVMLHVDGGDIGVYEFPGGPDTPIVAGGMPVMAEIAVTGTEVTPAPEATPPGTLPVTSGDGPPLGLLGAALALLVAGRLLLARVEDRLPAPQAA
jgi:hypothetical protein